MCSLVVFAQKLLGRRLLLPELEVGGEGHDVGKIWPCPKVFFGGGARLDWTGQDRTRVWLVGVWSRSHPRVEVWEWMKVEESGEGKKDEKE